MVKSSIHGATPYFEYLSILILPFEIFIDAPTLLIFLADFHTELAKVATVNNVLCSRDPTEWSDQNTIIHIARPGAKRGLESPFRGRFAWDCIAGVAGSRHFVVHLPGIV